MSAYVKVGGEFAVNSVTADDQLGARITVFTDGAFLITWVTRAAWPNDFEQVIKAQGENR